MKTLGVVLTAAFLALALSSARPAPAAGGGSPASATGFASIVAGAVITQGFGCTSVAMEPFDPACPALHFHSGIDLAAPLGTPVFAAAAGGCTVIDDATGYGLHVVISHAGGLETLYGHLERVTVRSDELVARGQEVGLLGSSGNSTGPHVHFEVRSDSIPVDPTTWLPALQRVGASPPPGFRG